MQQPVTIFWFRRDLRLDDNVGLYHALISNYPVLPIFIFDSDILNKLPEDDSRVSFIYERLVYIHNQLKKIKRQIAIYQGKPKEVFKELLSKYDINEVFTNHDYEPYAISRDKEIEALLGAKGIQFRTYKDQVIFERNEIVKQDGSPYKVYTPYSRKWLEQFKINGVDSFTSEDCLENCIASTELPFLSLIDIGFKESRLKIKEFNIGDDIIDDYEATRNFPALDNTSRIGPHLRFGSISIRKLVRKASEHANITFLKELIWREFFMQILWHFPHTSNTSFKPQYDRIEWRNNEDEFRRWCDGKTGYPIVDAGMRQLNETGFMHNRVRMLVGSFLCKHLLIDWRWGEAYFAEKLHDYEMASNIGNWQWVAGCGVDAAPYFRIFNPTTQIKKFDKDHNYIKKWVPDYQELSYPSQIVDHKIARERCLKAYRAALN